MSPYATVTDWSDLDLEVLEEILASLTDTATTEAMRKAAYSTADAEKRSHRPILHGRLAAALARFCPKCGEEHGYPHGTQARPCQACVAAVPH